MKKETRNILITAAIVVAMLVCVIGAVVCFSVYNQLKANYLAQITAYSPADSANGNPGSMLNPDRINVDPEVWSKPQVEGQQVTEYGAIYYTQSGVPNTQILNGSIGSKEVLILDAHEMVIDGKSYQMGAIVIIPGPVAKLNPISITNGAGQLVPLDEVQNKLDNEYWLKFCRGTIREDKTFPYSTWDLTTKELAGYTFLPYPSACPRNAADEAKLFSLPSDTTLATGQRETTGVGNTKAFLAGTPVIGFKIVVGDMTYNQCYLASPKEDGYVTDGVMFPNPDEIAGAKPCK